MNKKEPSTTPQESALLLRIKDLEEKLIEANKRAEDAFYAGRKAGVFADHPIYHFRTFLDWEQQLKK